MITDKWLITLPPIVNVKWVIFLASYGQCQMAFYSSSYSQWFVILASFYQRQMAYYSTSYSQCQMVH